jgi:hypothetical protein
MYAVLKQLERLMAADSDGRQAGLTWAPAVCCQSSWTDVSLIPPWALMALQDLLLLLLAAVDQL